jgi:hypothetical protein
MNAEPKHPELHQEEDRLPPAPILLAFALVGLIGIFLAIWAWYSLQRREQAVRPSGGFPERELGPRHTVSEIHENIYGDLGPGQILNDQKRKQLASFEWIDRRRRIVTIPIDDAIALMLAGQRR